MHTFSTRLGITLFATAAMVTHVAADDIDLTTEKTKLGYVYGYQIASELIATGLAEDFDIEAVKAAITDVTSGKEVRMTQEEMQAAQMAYQQKKQAEYEAMMSANKAKGDAYLAENAQKAGVTQTESGLQWELLREGKGAAPTQESTVVVHYEGKLIDGTTFDSSYERGTPATFNAIGVIPGFSEGILLMKEGGKRRLHIPSDLAYGPQGSRNIGPNEVLVFDVELIEVVQPAAAESE